MSNLQVISQLLRSPARPCPVKGFPLAIMDLTIDGHESYSLVLSVQDFTSSKYTDIERMQLAQWLSAYLLPEMNKYAPVSISKIEKRLADIDGWGKFE